MTTTEVRANGTDETAAPRSPAVAGPGRRRLAAILVGVALAAVLGLVVANEVQADARYDQAHRALDAVRSRTTTVNAELVTARADLAALDQQVTQDSAVLATDTARLDAALAALAQSQQDNANRSTAIANLQTCLGGVEQALNALAVGDQHSAVRSLQAVASACSAAVASVG